ncbi:MAG: cupin-like domain-containing protein [Chitinophagales bacterium]|nr:cupin-like domain-containing protein [Chitinophagales bacterium]
MRPANVNTFDWWLYNIMFFIEHFIGTKLSHSLFNNLHKKIQNRISHSDGIEQRAIVFPTASIEYNSFEEFKSKNPDYYKSIAIFRGVTKDWESTKKWNKDFFKNEYGATKINLIDNAGLVDPEVENKFKETNFKDYFDEAETDKSKYLRFSRILDHNPHLLKDLDMDWLRQFNHGKTDGGTYMFIGEGGTKTPMHNAIAHTLFIQVKGDKKWTIYAPNERLFLDARAERFPYFRTDANPHQLNDPNFPLLKYTQRYEFVISEGDVLWMPSFFWHYVENLSSNIGVAYKFTKTFDSLKNTKMLTILTYLQTKPTLISYFINNRFRKQDNQFSKKTSQYS